MNLVSSWLKIRPSTVGFINQKWPIEGLPSTVAFGSGVCFDKRGVIATAKHVIINAFQRRNIGIDLDVSDRSMEDFPKDICILFSLGDNGRQLIVPMRSVSFDIHRDLAFVFIPERNDYPVAIMPPDDYFLTEGQFIAAAGFPLMDKKNSRLRPSLFHGIISRSTPDETYLDINLHRGNSGGPVFTEDKGELIGIVVEYREAVVSASTSNERISVSYPTNIALMVDYKFIKAGFSSIEKQTKLLFKNDSK